MSVSKKLIASKRVLAVDCERDILKCVVVTLKEGYEFNATPGKATRLFNTYTDAYFEVQNYTRLKDKS